MKRKLGSLLLIGTLALLASCGEISSPTSSLNPIIKPTTSSSGTTDIKNDVTFSVKLTQNNGSSFLLTDPEVEAVWQNNTTTITAPFTVDDEGMAVASTTGLDGEYYVHLTKCPKNYTYDPNKTIVTTDNPECNIELMRLAKPTKGKGTDLFDKIYEISDLNPSTVGRSYVFEATISSASDVVYYGFEPKVSGTYTIESMVDMLDNKINPKVLAYYPGSANTAYFNQEINNGGSYLDGGFTRNFKFEVNFTDRNIGNVAKFGIKAEINDSIEYPITVPFKITYQGTYDGSLVNRKVIYAEEMYYKRDSDGNYIVDEDGNYELNYVPYTEADKYTSLDFTGDDGHSSTFYNKLIDPEYESDGKNHYLRRRFSLVDGKYIADPNGTYILKSTMKEVQATGTYQEFGNYDGFRTGSNIVLDQNKLYYNESDGYYHIIDNGVDHIVCAKLTSAISSFEVKEILHLEDEGDRMISSISTNQYDEETGLRIIENYKYFLDAEYADLASQSVDGVVYVNKEVMTFLQKLSNSAHYFFDGNGWCEQNGVFASEENQWLFACGFYRN